MTDTDHPSQDQSPDPTASLPQWVTAAGFGAVALVVGLIGFAISSRFEPSEFAPTPFVAADITTSTSLAFDGQSSSTTTSAELATTSSSAASPANFEVSSSNVDFGDDGTSAQFDVSNVGGRQGSFTLGASTTAISVSTGSGDLAPSESMTIQLSLDRVEIGEGEIDETISISWEGGQLEVSIVGVHQDNPIIHNPQASPAQIFVSGTTPCGPTTSTISARVRDSSELESVVVRWGGTETAMGPVGNDIFEGVIGPFVNPQTAAARIVATDQFGNAGGATVEVVVAACP
jgi:hypothetical protein